MSAITITATGFCPGGGHAYLSVTGDKVLSLTVDISVLNDPITNDEAEAFVKIIGKMAKNGRTVAQAKALMQAGVTVTV